MARGNFESRVVAVRLDRNQKALDEALLVPWPQLEAAVLEYIDWHSFVLWVRAVNEAAGELPDRLRSELCDRCPGFLESANARNRSRWKSLDAWITASRFARRQGRALVRRANVLRIRGPEVRAGLDAVGAQ